MAEFIDAVVVKGAGNKRFTVSIEERDETETSFIPFDLSNYLIRFRVLGAPTADGKVLIEHTFDANSEIDKGGQITDGQNGQFTFTITEEDQEKLAVGKYPIDLSILTPEDNSAEIILTEGGERGEFNCIRVVQV